MNPKIPTTQVLSGKIVREKLREGIDILAEAVATTLGSRGRMVGIDRIYENSIIRDGVTVAKSITLADKAQNFGASILRESAQKTVMDVGDGTTATIILAQALYHEAEKVVAAGTNPRALFDEIEKDIKYACALLKDMAIPVTSLKQKCEIATISAEEEELGQLIGEIIHKIGKDGVVTVGKSKTGETYIDMQEGMQWDKGFASPYFITDPNTMTATIEDGYIMVCDFDISNMQQLLPMIEDFLKHGHQLTIIAPSFGGDALPSLILNKMQNKFLAMCIKAPGYGEEEQRTMLEDIAILTGASFITQTQGHNLSDARTEHFGHAERISSDQFTSLIVGGAGKKNVIDARIAEIRKQLKDEESEIKQEKLKERLAKLTNGVAVIKVGGKTDVEIKERYERALDAGLATREAIEYGIVAGGEVVYLNLIGEMKSQIVKNALRAPFNRLVTNAGFDSGQMAERLEAQVNIKVETNMGVDVNTGEIVNMIEKGIIDPVSVLIAALTNACSVAIKLLGTEVLILPEDEKEIMPKMQ